MSWTKIELNWAIDQLAALGDIKLSRDGSRIAITDQGKEKAFALLHGHPICESLLLYLYCGERMEEIDVIEIDDT